MAEHRDTSYEVTVADVAARPIAIVAAEVWSEVYWLLA